MINLKVLGLISLFASTAPYAAGVLTPCNGFEIKIKNNLSKDLLISSATLKGATLQPGSMQKLNAHHEQVFVVNESTREKMQGEFLFHTADLSKPIKIRFQLENIGPICEHKDIAAKGNYRIVKTRVPGGLNYMISTK